MWCLAAAQVERPIMPPIDGTYPRAELTPASPTVADEVTLTWYMGVASNSCMAPTYESSFLIEGTPISSVRTYVISIEYTEIPVPPDKICPMIYDPVEYGPVYEFGQLNAGTYVVKDGDEIVTTFTVTDGSGFVGDDSVYVIPEAPTVEDSLLFNLFSHSICCCAAIHDKTVSVSDTVIYLDYAVDSEPCNYCDCVNLGEWLAFESGPLATGTYGIYKVEQYYCAPGDPCPLEMIMPVRVGEVTIGDGTSIVGNPGVVRNRGASVAGTVVKARLLDASGRLVRRWQGPAGEIRTEGVPEGTYFLESRTAAGKLSVSKIAVTR
jgi:hypothetical protein